MKNKYLFTDSPNIKVSCVTCALKTFPLFNGGINTNEIPNDNLFLQKSNYGSFKVEYLWNHLLITIIVFFFSLTLKRDQVHLLVYGPDRPYFKQKQKNNITKFSPNDFLKSTIFCFSASWGKKEKK